MGWGVVSRSAARHCTGRPVFRGLRYFRTLDVEGSRTRRYLLRKCSGEITSAGLSQTAAALAQQVATAGLKQPSLRRVRSQTLGRRNADPVQSTTARPGPRNAAVSTTTCGAPQAPVNGIRWLGLAHFMNRCVPTTAVITPPTMATK
jgi:hypothetical protein